MGKRILGILILIAGIVMILFSNYIFEQIGEGNAKIASAESKMEAGKTMFGMAPKQVTENPLYKGSTGMMTSSIQQKIDEGKHTIAYYEQVATWLKWGGWAAVIIGALLFLFSFGKKKK